MSTPKLPRVDSAVCRRLDSWHGALMERCKSDQVFQEIDDQIVANGKELVAVLRNAAEAMPDASDEKASLSTMLEGLHVSNTEKRHGSAYGDLPATIESVQTIQEYFAEQSGYPDGTYDYREEPSWQNIGKRPTIRSPLYDDHSALANHAVELVRPGAEFAAKVGTVARDKGGVSHLSDTDISDVYIGNAPAVSDAVLQVRNALRLLDFIKIDGFTLLSAELGRIQTRAEDLAKWAEQRRRTLLIEQQLQFDPPINQDACNRLGTWHRRLVEKCKADPEIVRQTADAKAATKAFSEAFCAGLTDAGLRESVETGVENQLDPEKMFQMQFEELPSKVRELRKSLSGMERESRLYNTIIESDILSIFFKSVAAVRKPLDAVVELDAFARENGDVEGLTDLQVAEVYYRTARIDIDMAFDVVQMYLLKMIEEMVKDGSFSADVDDLKQHLSVLKKCAHAVDRRMREVALAS